MSRVRNVSIRPRGDQNILARRQREDYIQTNEQTVLGFKGHHSRAKWENQLYLDGIKKTTQRVQDNLNNQYDSDLQARRIKLANLYNQEIKQWKEECLQNIETPEDRKQNMIRKAKELKERREAERIKLVETVRLQQYREACDDVRALDSQRILQAVVVDREKQLEEKKQILEEEKEYEKRMHHLEELSCLEKKAREDQDRETMHKRNVEVKNILDLQVQLYQERLEKEKEMDESQNHQLLELWKQQLHMDNEHKQRIREDAIQRAEDVKWFNKERMAMRQEQAQYEKEYDMKLLRLALEKEANESLREKESQERFKVEQTKYQDILKRQMEIEAEDHSYLDSLRTQMENEEWDKKEAKHKAEADARQQLLNDVLNTREDQIQEKEERKMKLMKEEQEYAQHTLDQVQQMLHQEQEKERHMKNTLKVHENHLKSQIANKQKKQERELQNEYLNFKEFQHAERQHDKMVQKIIAEKPVVDHRRKTSQWSF